MPFISGPTWYDAYNQVNSDLGRAEASYRITEAKVLGYLTAARQEIQNERAIIRKRIDICLNGSCNVYSLPCSIWQVQRVDFCTDPSFKTPWHVDEVDYDTFQKLRGQEIASQLFSRVVVMRFNDELHVYPDNQTGYLRMVVVPYCVPYTKDNLVDWKLYGEDPTEQMKLHGPEAVIIGAWTGIVAYAKIELVMSMPDELRAYSPSIPHWRQQWAEGKATVHGVETYKDVPIKPRTGILA